MADWFASMVFFLMCLRPPGSTLFPYTTLFRSWFARQLRESPEADVARQYLGSRGLDLETVLPLGLGYAPTGKALLDAMKDRKSTRLNSSHLGISYAVFCLKKKSKTSRHIIPTP